MQRLWYFEIKIIHGWMKIVEERGVGVCASRVSRRYRPKGNVITLFAAKHGLGKDELITVNLDAPTLLVHHSFAFPCNHMFSHH